MRRIRAVCLIVCVVAGQAGRATAQDELAPGDRAVELGRSGIELYRAGRYGEAHDAFATADAAVHSPVFVVYMARCRAAEGRLLDAQRLFSRVTAEVMADDAPEPWRAARREAEEESRRLAESIPTLRVRWRGPPTPDVEIDGRPLSAFELGRPVALDPGVHRIVGVSGDVRRELEVRLEAGDPERLVDLDLRGPPPPPAHATVGPWPVLGGIALGVAGAGFVTGAITGGVAIAKTRDIEGRCVGNSCLASDAEEAASAEDFATASTITFVGGGVFAGAGLAFLFLPPLLDTSPQVVQVGLDGRARGVVVSGAF